MPISKIQDHLDAYLKSPGNVLKQQEQSQNQPFLEKINCLAADLKNLGLEIKHIDYKNLSIIAFSNFVFSFNLKDNTAKVALPVDFEYFLQKELANIIRKSGNSHNSNLRVYASHFSKINIETTAKQISEKFDLVFEKIDPKISKILFSKKFLFTKPELNRFLDTVFDLKNELDKTKL